MSAEAVGKILERAMADVDFRELLAREPDAALLGYELTAEERSAFATGTIEVERLEERISKSDLSAAVAAKTGSPILRAPSEMRRPDGG